VSQFVICKLWAHVTSHSTRDMQLCLAALTVHGSMAAQARGTTETRILCVVAK
jgi:hypothetical protein